MRIHIHPEVRSLVHSMMSEQPQDRPTNFYVLFVSISVSIIIID